MHRRPLVHVLATGTELLRGRRAARAGPDPRVQPAHAAAARRARRRRGRRRIRSCRTTAAATRAAVEAALAGDVLLVSGGVSVGPHDHVKPALRGARRARRSSGACGSSRASRCGSAAAAPRSSSACPATRSPTVACFLLFVGPALRRLQGEADAAPRVRAGAARGRRRGRADGRTTLLTAALERGADGCSRRRRPRARGRTSRARWGRRTRSRSSRTPRRAAGGRDRRRAAALTARVDRAHAPAGHPGVRALARTARSPLAGPADGAERR